jgi:hypothetical protein
MTEEKPLQANSLGLAGLHELKQRSVADGKKIFDLVMEDEADAQALEGLVYQESLLQLILYVLDYRQLLTSRVNQGKSAKQRKAATYAEKEKVFDWCNSNRERAWLPYKSSIEEAMASTNISARTSVRDYISEWRKSNPKK